MFNYFKKVTKNLFFYVLPEYFPNIIGKYIKKYVRKYELIEKLAQKNLKLRSDSRLCNLYINGGIENMNNLDVQINSVDDIVDIMEEMDFYFKHTNYKNMVKQEIMESCNSVFQSSKIIKSKIVEGINEDLLKIAPKRVAELADRINVDVGVN